MVGVPLTTPVDVFRVRPAGNVPETIEYVKPGVPPLMASCELYAVPTTALPAPQEPQSRFTGEVRMMMVQVVVSVFPCESTTFDVKV